MPHGCSFEENGITKCAGVSRNEKNKSLLLQKGAVLFWKIWYNAAIKKKSRRGTGVFERQKEMRR